LKNNYGARGIVGTWVNPLVMIYATGGWVRGNFRDNDNLNFQSTLPITAGTNFLPAQNQSFTKHLSGYQVGFGFEGAITPNISLRAQYEFNRYSNFNSTVVSQVNDPTDTDSVFIGTNTLTIHPQVHQVRLILDYHFRDRLWG
jgi:opacity protein-like surface antigen